MLTKFDFNRESSQDHFELFGNYLAVMDTNRLILLEISGKRRENIKILDQINFKNNLESAKINCIRKIGDTYSNQCHFLLISEVSRDETSFFTTVSIINKKLSKLILKLEKEDISNIYQASKKELKSFLFKKSVIGKIYIKDDGIYISLQRKRKYNGILNNLSLSLKFEAFQKFNVQRSCFDIFSLERKNEEIVFLVFFTSSFDLNFVAFESLSTVRFKDELVYKILDSRFIDWDVSSILCMKTQPSSTSINIYYVKCILVTHNSFIVRLKIKISFDNLENIDLEWNIDNVIQGGLFKQNIKTIIVEDYSICLNVRPDGDEYQNWIIDVYKNKYQGIWSSINLGYQMPAKIFLIKKDDGQISLNYILPKIMNIYESLIGEASIKIKEGIVEKDLPENITIKLQGADLSIQKAIINFERKPKRKKNPWFYFSIGYIGLLLIMSVIGLTIFCCIVSKKRKRRYRKMKKKMI